MGQRNHHRHGEDEGPTLQWRWTVMEISMLLTTAMTDVRIYACPAESMASGKTKRFRAPETSEIILTSPLIPKGRFTLYRSTSTTRRSSCILVRLIARTERIGLYGRSSFWPVVEVDSNDAVHIAYRTASTHKDVMYMTNASGSWSTPSKVEEYGGWGSRDGH